MMYRKTTFEERIAKLQAKKLDEATRPKGERKLRVREMHDRYDVYDWNYKKYSVDENLDLIYAFLKKRYGKNYLMWQSNILLDCGEYLGSYCPCAEYCPECNKYMYRRYNQICEECENDPVRIEANAQEYSEQMFIRNKKYKLRKEGIKDPELLEELTESYLLIRQLNKNVKAKTS